VVKAYPSFETSAHWVRLVTRIAEKLDLAREQADGVFQETASGGRVITKKRSYCDIVTFCCEKDGET